MLFFFFVCFCFCFCLVLFCVCFVDFVLRLLCFIVVPVMFLYRFIVVVTFGPFKRVQVDPNCARKIMTLTFRLHRRLNMDTT